MLEHHTLDLATGATSKGSISVTNAFTVLDLKAKIAAQAGVADVSRVLLVKAKNTSSWTSGVGRTTT